MSREFYEGFETRDFSLWDGVVGAPTIVSGISGMNGYCLKCAPSQYPWKNLAPRQERYFHIKWRPTVSSGSWGNCLVFYYNSTRLMSVIRNFDSGRGDYFLNIRTSGSTYPAWSDLPIRVNTTYTVEVYYKVHPTNGVITVKIDGVEWLTWYGNTSSGNITTCNKISLEPISSYDYPYFDDLIIDTENWIGPAALGFMKTNGAGDLVGWTPSSEPAYNCLNETPISMERFLTTADPASALFAVTDPPSIGTNVVKGLQLMTLGTITGSPAAMYHRQLLKSNGLVDRGDQRSLPSALNPLCRMMELNPTTGQRFTEHDLVNLQIGLEAEV